MADDKYYNLEHDTVEEAENPVVPIQTLRDPEQLSETAEQRRLRRQELRARLGEKFTDWMDPRNPALWVGDTDED